MNPYKEFNSSLKFFIRELIGLYPNVIELKVMLSLYKIMKTVNKKSPQKYFNSLISEDSQELINKNWEYFMNKNYDDSQFDKFANVIKDIYKTMDEENKETVWRHLIVLYKLSESCNQKVEA